MGYHRAGFELVGVDERPQPNYPFEFHQGDANDWPLDGFDAVHASPPCGDHSALVALTGVHGTGWMLSHTLDRLAAAQGLPYVVENVERADLPGSLVLCGTEFGLRVGDRWLKRHRRFVSNVFLMGGGGGATVPAARSGASTGVRGVKSSCAATRSSRWVSTG